MTKLRLRVLCLKTIHNYSNTIWKYFIHISIDNVQPQFLTTRKKNYIRLSLKILKENQMVPKIVMCYVLIILLYLNKSPITSYCPQKLLLMFKSAKVSSIEVKTVGEFYLQCNPKIYEGILFYGLQLKPKRINTY